MRTIVDGFREMVHLIGDTFRLWWRNLLPLATWFLAGYVGFKACIEGAIWLSEHSHGSIGVGLFSAGVLMQIAAYVGMIRTCATSLYRWRDAASNQAEETVRPDPAGPAGVAGRHPASAGRGVVGLGLPGRPGLRAQRQQPGAARTAARLGVLPAGRRPVAQVPAGDRDPAGAAPGARSGRRPLAEPAGEVRPGLGGVVLPADHRRRDAVRDPGRQGLVRGPQLLVLVARLVGRR